MNALELAKFWMRVGLGTDTQCWEWRGAKNPRGYGRVAGHRKMAHRVAYELVCGPIPPGKLLRHKCDNPACCNPKHLVPGSHQDNMTDMVARKRAARGVRNGRTSLSTEDVAYIRKNPDNMTGRALALKFNMATSSITYIRNGRSWKYQK